MMKPSMETCGPCGAELLFLLGVSLQFEINCVSDGNVAGCNYSWQQPGDQTCRPCPTIFESRYYALDIYLPLHLSLAVI